MGGSLLQLLAVFASGVFAQVIIPRAPGESVTLRCEYSAEYSSNSKTWCRENINDKRWCNTILTTAVTSSISVTRTSGRTTIRDDKTAQVMSVTVQDLREEDSGRYWCGVYFHNENQVHILKTPELQVSRGLNAQVIPRGPGESLELLCDYPETYRNNGKTWCRAREDVCDPIVTASDEASSGRTTIRDNKTVHQISVTFENLHVLDSGEYWCAANVDNNFKITKRFQLQVSEDIRSTPITVTTTPNVSTGYTQGQDARGDPESADTGSLSDLKIILIAVALGVLLLLTIIALAFVIRIRRRRKQRIMGSSNKRTSAETVASRNTRSSEVDPASGPGELDSQEVKYATLTLHGSRDQRDATYSNVSFHRRTAASNDMPENVEYASINLQPR